MATHVSATTTTAPSVDSNANYDSEDEEIDMEDPPSDEGINVNGDTTMSSNVNEENDDEGAATAGNESAYGSFVEGKEENEEKQKD